MWFAVILLIVLAAAVLAIVWWMTRKRTLPAAVRSRLMGAFAQLGQLPDPHRRILDAEKILDQALTALGFSGTFGEKLTKAGPRFSDVESVWRAHKLRNRIAHEVGITIGAPDADRAVAAFRRGVEDL